MCEVLFQPFPVVGEEPRFAFRPQQFGEGCFRDWRRSFCSLIWALSGLAKHGSSFQRTLEHGSNQRHESNFHEHRLFSGHLAPQGIEKASVVHGTAAPR